MNPASSYARSTLWWAVPLAALAGILAYETDVGRALRKTPPPPEAVEPKPVATALLPEYAIAGGVAARRETVERTLFTPTRRPAPEPAVEAAKPRMQRGQFALTGTAIVEGKNVAFLRETNGGRSRRVMQGETINGLVVAEVKADRVKLAMGDESEEVVLRVTTNPRVTPQPAVATAPAQPRDALPPPIGTPAAVAAPGGSASNQQEVAQTLAERRRAAREAQAAAQRQMMSGGGAPAVNNAQPPQEQTSPTPPNAGPNDADPNWSGLAPRPLAVPAQQ